MHDVIEPYGAADARADASRLRKAQVTHIDLLSEVRDRLAATEGARHPYMEDPDYPDMSEALRYLDLAIRTDDLSLMEQVAQEMKSAADALDQQRSNTPPRTTAEPKTGTRSVSRQDRHADQIWKHDGERSTS